LWLITRSVNSGVRHPLPSGLLCRRPRKRAGEAMKVAYREKTFARYL
jgi:hypothetical protein